MADIGIAGHFNIRPSLGGLEAVLHMMFANFVGLCWWRLHRKCPNYICDYRKGKRRETQESQNPPPKKNHKASILGGHRLDE